MSVTEVTPALGPSTNLTWVPGDTTDHTAYRGLPRRPRHSLAAATAELSLGTCRADGADAAAAVIIAAVTAGSGCCGRDRSGHDGDGGKSREVKI